MAVRKFDIWKDNISVFLKGFKMGDVSATKMNYYKIYCFFDTLPKDESIMQRYADVAESLGVNEQIVMRAVKEFGEEIEI